MKLNFFLITNSRGTTRTAKNRPDLKWDEISIAIQLELPDLLFKKPQLQASIIIPDKSATPPVISGEVTEHIRQAIAQHTGVEVKIQVLEPKGK